MDQEVGRAAIHELDLATGKSRIFAGGLRNPVGMAWEPTTGALWTVVNERDELGPNLVPDYLTSVREGGFYGWPYAYWGPNADPRVRPQDPAKVAATLRPDYSLGSHVAALGVAFSVPAMGARFAEGVFVGEHGSWNRPDPSGYKVVFIPFRGGRPAGAPVDMVTGFRDPGGHTYGRPVGVAVDPRGALLVADDLSNTIWRIVPMARAPAAEAPARGGAQGKAGEVAKAGAPY
jgi:glucose/arabinose dehydrogenase